MTKYLIASFFTLSIVSFTVITHAEPAPVYDADTYAEQFEAPKNNRAPAPAANSAATSQNIEQDDVNEYADDDADHAPQAAPLNSPQRELSAPERLKRMEQQILNLQNSETSKRVDALEHQVQTMQGQVDELNHQLILLKANKSESVDEGKKTAASSADKKSASHTTGKRQTKCRKKTAG